MNWKQAIFGKTEHRSIIQEENMSNGTILSWAGLSGLGALNLSTFYRGVQLISTSISQLPIYTKKVNGKGTSNILKNHPTNLLWDNPSSLVDRVTMIRSIVQNVILRGNAYVYIERAEDGTPLSLRYLPSSDVTINYVKERNFLCYNCSYILNGKNLNPADMLHFKLFSFDGIQGVSLLKYSTQSVDTANATNQHAKEFFESGTNKASGILTVNSQLSEKQRLQILNT